MATSTAVTKIVFVLGRPGSGKGTQCEKLVESYGDSFHHLSAGERLREERKKLHSPFKAILDTHFDNGTLIPAKITVQILFREILFKTGQKQRNVEVEEETKKSSTFLIDGFPPNLENYEEWQRQLTDYNSNNLENILQLSFILYFDAAEDVCLRRCLKRGRSGSAKSNDLPINIQRRFTVFNEGVIPVMEKFQEEKVPIRTISITGIESIDEIFQYVEGLFDI